MTVPFVLSFKPISYHPSSRNFLWGSFALKGPPQSASNFEKMTLFRLTLKEPLLKMFSQKPQHAAFIGPHPWRLFAAFCLFMAFIAIGGWILSKTLGALSLTQDFKQKNNKAEHQKAGVSSGKELLFYRVVGNTSIFEPSLSENNSTLEEELNKTPKNPTLDAGSESSVTKPINYTIEIKKTTDRSEAEELVKSLQSKGIQAFYTPMLSNNFVIYRVRVGIYGSKAIAQKDLLMIAPHAKGTPLIAVLK